MKGKTKKVLEYLQVNGSITSIEAFEKFRATRLSAIIFNLRKYGHKIASIPAKYTNQEGETSYFVRYTLEQENVNDKNNNN